MTKFEECEAEILAIKTKYGYGVFDMVMRGLNRKRLSVAVPMKRRPLRRAEKEKLYGKQHGDCSRCGRHFEIDEMTDDHFIPKSRGGSEHISNRRLCCKPCNSSKGANSPSEEAKLTGKTVLEQIQNLPGRIGG